MPKTKCVLGASLCLLLGFTDSTGAVAPDPAPVTSEQAEALLQAGRWAEAAAAYQALAVADPGNGQAWMRLGISLDALGRHAEAIAALERAEPVHFMPFAVRYQMARIHARSGDRERAIAALEQAVAGGFVNLERLGSDPALAELRQDPRFAALLTRAQVGAAPCGTLPEYGSFDFFVGQWDLEFLDQPAGSSTVERRAEGCVVVETFVNPSQPQQNAVTFSLYDPQLRTWRQTYTDATGMVAVLAGRPDGERTMRFEGEMWPRVGPASSLRVTYTAIGPDAVRQLSEWRRGAAGTWRPLYDIRYLRRH